MSLNLIETSVNYLNIILSIYMVSVVHYEKSGYTEFLRV